MVRRRTWLIGTVAAALLLVGFIAFILPGIVRSQMEKQVSRATGRTLTIGRISINPLTWTAGMEGVRLSEKGSGLPFVSFSSARVRVSPTSVWRLAPVLTDIRLAAPHVRIVRTGPNRFNFSDLLEKKPGVKKEQGEPARFSLNNIVVSNGSIDFLDDALSTPKQHAVRQLLIQVPFISNIPYLADRYVAPKLTAVVNGAPFAFEGKMKPFAEGMEASVAIKLRELDIPFYAAYFPKELPLKVMAGRFTTDLAVSHRLAKGKLPDIAANGTVTLTGIDLRDRSGEPLLALSKGALAISRFGLLSGEYRAASISLDAPVVTVSRNRQGGWNFQQLTGKSDTAGKSAAEAGKTPEEAAGKAQKPLIAVGEARVTNGTVRFSDAVPRGGFSAEAGQLAITVAGFTNEQGKTANLSLGFTTPRNERFEASGTLSVTPLAFTVRPVLTNGVVETSYPYLANYLTAPVSGRLNASGELSYSAEQGLRIAGGDLQLRQLALSFAPREGVSIPLLAVNGVAYSQKEQLLTVDKVTQQGGAVVISRDAAGVFSPTRLLRKQPASPVPLPAKQKKGAEKGTPFSFAVKQVAMSGLNASFTDHTREDAPTFTLKKASLSLSDLRGPRMASMPFRFAAGYGQKGSLRAGGRITPYPFLFKGNVVLARIPVLDAEPYLPEGLNVVLADGSLDATLALDLAARPAGIGGSFKGSAGVRNFYSLDAEENEDLLKWESLQLDGVSGTLAPFSLQLAGVSLNNYYARVIINRQGVVNLQELYQPEPGTAVAAKPASAAAVSAPSAVPVPAAAAAPKSVRIDTVTLQDGVLNFTDRHLSREFSTTMVNLGGRISGLTSEEGKAADVDLRGNLENQSPLRITGRINPLKGDLFLDILIRFSDIELAPMTPYSGTYLGYTVDKGKLTLDLRYLIEQKRLKAENKVFMDQLTFGDAVASDKATRLPVRLAVALLKDRKGEIRLDLPVAGRTDDPDFSVWGVVWQMLKNLLVKAATSPLSLIQSMIGGGDDFSGVAFSPGTSSLSAAEEGKLRNLAKALLDRPAIKLEVTGFVDREKDAEGYRSELLLKKMKTEKLLALVKEKREMAGQSADSVEILPAEYSLFLKRVYEKEKFPKPRTFIGTLKSLPDAEMKKLILANTVVEEPQLRTLARERALAVRNFLVADGRLPQERIFEKSGDIFAPPKQEGMSGSRVEFGAVAQ